MAEKTLRLSALLVIHNEEEILEECLSRLGFADEIVVVLDKCTDNSESICQRYTQRMLKGSWEIEGDRRNQGIDYCQGDWILEVDADEWVTQNLAAEIKSVIAGAEADIYNIPVHNYVSGKWIRHGWGGNFGKNGYPGLFRKGVKRWGKERIHPNLVVTGKQGPDLTHAIIHHIDKDISDMIRRFNSYTTARAKDLRDRNEIGDFKNMVRKIFSRFWKSYVARKGYKEGGYGFLIALFAALYPVVSHCKAALDEDL